MKATLERAMLERLRLYFPPGVRIALYNGELADFAAAVRTLPALWLRWSSAGTPQVKDAARKRLATVHTFAVVAAGRSVTASGAHRDAGVYTLLDRAAALLEGHDFGLDGVAPLMPGPARTLMAGNGVAVLSQDLTTTIHTRRQPPDQRPAPFIPADGGAGIPAPQTPGWNWESESSPLPPPDAPPLSGLSFHYLPWGSGPVFEDRLPPGQTPQSASAQTASAQGEQP